MCACASVCSGGGQSDCVSLCMSVWTLCGGVGVWEFSGPKWLGEGGGVVVGVEGKKCEGEEEGVRGNGGGGSSTHSLTLSVTVWRFHT